MSNECTTYEMKWPKIAVDKMRDVYSWYGPCATGFQVLEDPMTVHSKRHRELVREKRRCGIIVPKNKVVSSAVYRKQHVVF